MIWHPRLTLAQAPHVCELLLRELDIIIDGEGRSQTVPLQGTVHFIQSGFQIAACHRENMVGESIRSGFIDGMTHDTDDAS